MLTGVAILSAQTKIVTGTVSDEDGHAVVGATIVVSGTSVGASTGADGKFSLEAPDAAKNLQVSFVGMETETVALTGAHLDIVLKTSIELGEVVITALGISREKRTQGYASSSLSGGDIANLKTVNPMTALQGRVAGMDVSSSPSPGGTQNINIRGFNVLNRSSQPLYIVDGVPLTNIQNQAGSLTAVNTLNSQADFGSGINAINPNDIENITVLKGSAASALYGSRAAQGVIMITTKSGKNTGGRIRAEYSGGVSIQQVGRLPGEQTMFGQGWGGDRALDENGSWGPAFDGKDRVWGNIVDNAQKLKPYVYLKNRIRDFYDLGIGYNNALSLSGGTEQTRYHVSVSQSRLDGPVPSDDDSYNRYTIATNASHSTRKVQLSSSFNFSVERNKVSPTGQDNSIYRSLNEIATDISIVDLKNLNDPFNSSDNYFTPYGLNPYFVLNIKDAIQDKYKFFGKLQLDYNPFSSLKLTYRFGGDFESSIADMHVDAVRFSAGAPNEGSSNESPGTYSQARRQRIQTNHDLFASFNKPLGGDFSLNVLAGVNANESSFAAIEGEISSIDIPGFYDFRNSLSPAVARQRSSLYRILGAYVNADVSYKSYLYLTLTARNDWSSTLPANNNSYFYPASMLSFILSDFLKKRALNVGFLDFAKLRAAYGRTGKDATLYRVHSLYVASTVVNPGYPSIDNLTFPLGGVNAYTVSNVAGNPDLKPELTDEFEIGVEAQFLDKRIGIDFSYYDKFTKGLIDVKPLDPSTGFTAQETNIGDVRNRGVELSVSLVPVRTPDFQWDLTWNYTRNRNKVERLDAEEIYLGGYSGMGIYAVEGKALGQFKSQMAQKTIIDGKEYTVVNGNGMPQPTPDDVYLGKDINEKYRMGLVNTFTWKGISLSGTLDFRYGGSIYCYTKDYMQWVGNGPETVYNDRRPFLIPNSVTDNGDGTYSENTVPVSPAELHTFYSNGGFRYDDHAVIDRSYLKLRNVGLAYSLPKPLCDKLRISALRLSLSASNILLWTPRENQYIDPEVTSFGNDISAKFGEYGLTPPYQTYVFGVNLTF
jgi:TonB-linked SusC/RagA family outer membrane protein